MKTIEVKHCSGCPFGEYRSSMFGDIYDCKLIQEKVAIKSYIDDPMSADEKPVPDFCPLRTNPITIILNV